MTKEQSVFCYCGSPARLVSNVTVYGREYGNGLAYVCIRWPECRGYVGCHPDGNPLGTIADQETKKLRMKVHALIDPLWKNATNGRPKKINRGSVYGWLKRIMGGEKHIHVGEMSREDCLRALEVIPLNPYGSHYNRLERETVEERLRHGMTQEQAERRPGWHPAREMDRTGYQLEYMEHRDETGQVTRRLHMDQFKQEFPNGI